MFITIKVKNVYGVETFYPACQASELFAKIAGTRTLTRNTLRDVKALGYEVRVEQPEFTI
jgi:hypothetical protein